MTSDDFSSFASRQTATSAFVGVTKTLARRNWSTWPPAYIGKKGLDGTSLLVRPDTDLVVEAVPRSGNTAFLVRFQIANPASLLAHHTHAAAQVRRATSLGIPCAVIIRNPFDTTLSHLVRNPDTPALTVLLEYLSFYQTVSSVRERVALFRFESVVRSVGACTECVNRKFGTNFFIYSATDNNERRANSTISEYNRLDREHRKVATSADYTVASPNRAKDQRKFRRRASLATPATSVLLSRAFERYTELLESAEL